MDFIISSYNEHKISISRREGIVEVSTDKHKNFTEPVVKRTIIAGNMLDRFLYIQIDLTKKKETLLREFEEILMQHRHDILKDNSNIRNRSTVLNIWEVADPDCQDIRILR